MALPPLPRCLILDYYDSYTNNLLTLFTKLYSDKEVLKKVVVVKADRYSWDDFRRDVLPQIDCIILSPGPGRPDKPSDIGFALDLIKQHPLPILGICLGHQAIGVAFGAEIINTPQISHGHVIRVSPELPRSGLFAPRKGEVEEGSFEAVVYNSLVVDEATLPSELQVTAWSEPSNGPSTVMGLRHREHPITGVQYHPESISSTQGTSLLVNFLDQVHQYHANPASYPPLARPILDSCAYRIGSSSSGNKRKTARAPPPITPLPTPPTTPSSSLDSPGTSRSSSPGHRGGRLRMTERSFGNLGQDVKTADVFDTVIRKRGKGKGKAVGEVWLDGESPTRPTTTSLAAPSFLVTYSLDQRRITLSPPSGNLLSTGLKDGDTFWDWFDDAQRTLSTPQSSGQGFRGGWMGWFGYEMKEESLQGYKRHSHGGSNQVDACWSWSDWLLERTPSGEWILRGLLRDSDSTLGEDGRADGIGALLDQAGVHVGLQEDDFEKLHEELRSIMASTQPASTPSISRLNFQPAMDGDTYRHRIEDCRESIRQGDSYELTLTTSFRATLPPQSNPFELYLRLRAHNPAYYSTYISFPSISTPKGKGIHILSSSPERFLKVEHGDRRRIEMMPIKGTRKRVPRGTCVCTPTTGCRQLDVGSETCEKERVRMDLQIGQELQEDVKERAENLMIVDLIRSDLLSCCIPSTVTVPKLIALESYGVHNLVTTVQGYLGEDVSSVDAVKRCFPPGSMTGAPKLRSVQLLDEFEGGARRGIYSGALGYISADGAVDLSVVIRTIVVEGSSMSLGAGGAITWMSNADAEWDEVLVKVQSVTRGF